jgi:hypothetical protein
VLTTGSISVTFSAEMDTASVESAFTVTGSDSVVGTFTWSENTITFKPDAPWKTHHLYTLTIGTGAKDMLGNPMIAAYTATFRPELNMSDVNGDGIDDFMLGAPGNASKVYLFLGRSAWTDIDLASGTASAAYTVAGGGTGFGVVMRVVGDIDGDGYADMVLTNPELGQTPSGDEGLAAIIYGSSSPASIELSPILPEGTAALYGPIADSYLGVIVTPLGDINGDGLADFAIGGALPPLTPGDERLWIILGSTTRMSGIVPITDFSDAVITAPGLTPGKIFWAEGCDINGDELDDIIISGPLAAGGGTERGQVFVVKGSAAPIDVDLRSIPADQTINGPFDNANIGTHFGCGDINADGYYDLLISAYTFDSLHGEVFYIPGAATPASAINLADGPPSALFAGDAPASGFGAGICSPGDVNGDGFEDIIGGAILKNTYQGYAYLFLGSASPASVDLSTGGTASATYIGKPTSFFGQCLRIGDVTGDGLDDMVINAQNASGAGTGRGQVYIIFGSATPTGLDLNTQNPDVTITGQEDDDHLIIFYGF